MSDRSTQSNSSAEGVRLRLNLLGGFSVRLDSQEVPEIAFVRRKACHLPKLLALQSGHRLHRHQAMDLWWPDLLPLGSVAQLYRVVHHVRQAFTIINLALYCSTPSGILVHPT